MEEVSSVRLLKPDGSSIEGRFIRWEENPDDPDSVRLILEFEGAQLIADAEGFFDAMIAIRRELEAQGLRLECYGASLDVFPSGMARSMGPGEKAYKLELGRPAQTKDLVSIFESGPDVKPASIKEQEGYFDRWAESLG
jgi:hypothetical protein